MNLVILKGRLTRDPEIKFTQANSTKIASLNIAVNRKFKNAEGNYDADFFNCTAFGNSAEFIEKYFSKGQEALIEGRIQNRSWDDENGQRRYATDIIINSIEFCGSKGQTEGEPENVNQAELDVNVKNEGSDDLPF
jgi:single-strand DNA-binding protein